jgi:DNA-binding NtrC family response regulator
LLRPRIVLWEETPELRTAVADLSADAELELLRVSSPDGLLETCRQSRAHVAVLHPADPIVPPAIELIRTLHRALPQMGILLLGGECTPAGTQRMLEAGVDAFLSRTAAPGEIAFHVRRILRDAAGRAGAAGEAAARPAAVSERELVGESEAMQKIRALLPRLAAADSNVLITGESGSGKELVAECLHQYSRRKEKPFVCINCAAIPDSLLESELFGHERGAFTGADTQREGKLQIADGGTVFFDEIGDMSAYAQAKILRVIENKEIYRLGGRSRILLDVRVVAATNRSLEAMVNEGKFRKDLYFRLNVTRLNLPPLRERRADLIALINHILAQLNRRFGREATGFTPQALNCLLHYSWPGNVRELRNVLEATLVNLASRQISFLDFPEDFRKKLEATADAAMQERESVLSALLATNWNKSRAAERLHWSRMTLYRKMRKYHVVPMKTKPEDAA